VAENPRFEDAYREHVASLYRFCLLQTGSHADAEDLVADVFTSAFSATTPLPDDPDAVRRWLYRIARNAAIDRFRRRGTRTRLLEALGRTTERSAHIEDEAELRAEVREVMRVVSALPQRARELIAMRIGAGLSYAEIAAATGMSERAVTLATHRALKTVRTRLRPQE
jgi:RNA polymerase sigma-70 factor (ECF subfamily)